MAPARRLHHALGGLKKSPVHSLASSVRSIRQLENRCNRFPADSSSEFVQQVQEVSKVSVTHRNLDPDKQAKPISLVLQPLLLGHFSLGRRTGAALLGFGQEFQVSRLNLFVFQSCLRETGFEVGKPLVDQLLGFIAQGRTSLWIGLHLHEGLDNELTGFHRTSRVEKRGYHHDAMFGKRQWRRTAATPIDPLGSHLVISSRRTVSSLAGTLIPLESAPGAASQTD